MLNLPDKIENEQQLDDVLSQPSPELVSQIRSLASPLVILGAGGKMGPSLCVMAKRAAEAAGHALEVVAVSRFSNPLTLPWLEAQGIRVLPRDLLEREQVAKLPDSGNVVSLIGFKFGTAANPSLTWAMNTLAPANVVHRYGRARIVALSTGSVYPMSEASAGGADESSPLTPLGEYANAAVGRERIYQFQAARHAAQLCLIRLFYAVELRYGIVSELARAVAAGAPINLATGSFNCIWQRDANDAILRSFALCRDPHTVFNLSQPQIFSVRNVAAELGERLGVAPLFQGTEERGALLGNPSRILELLGPPPTPMNKVLDWTAQWIEQGGRDLLRPTGYAVRDGIY